MTFWSLHKVPPTLTKTCETTVWNITTQDYLNHIIFPRFTQVPLIGISGSSWQYDRRHKCNHHFWVQHKGYLSLRRRHIILSVQWEGLFTHQNGKYKYGLMTHQVPCLLLMIYLRMHSHQYILISLFHHDRNLSLWPSGQAWHALPYGIKFYRDYCRQTLQSSQIYPHGISSPQTEVE